MGAYARVASVVAMKRRPRSRRRSRESLLRKHGTSDLASVVSAFRLYHGMTQVDLGRETGLNEGHISLIENRRRHPRPMTIEKLARGLGLRTEWLLRVAHRGTTAPLPPPARGRAGTEGSWYARESAPTAVTAPWNSRSVVERRPPERPGSPAAHWWSAAEERQLVELAAAKTPYPEIAALLGRSPNSVTRKARLLGVRLATRRQMAATGRGMAGDEARPGNRTEVSPSEA